jgi:hypothetical protein
MNSCILFIILIIITLIFYIINYYILLDKKIERFNSDIDRSIDIVVARYNENLEWTLEEPFNRYQYIVYNKGDNENFEKKHVKKIINLNNVGKCDHTYLYHIIDSYDNIADITVFFPGSIDMIYKKKIGVKILNEINSRNKAVFISLNQNDIKKLHYNFKLDHYKTSHKNNKTKNSENLLKKSTIRPYGLWFENMFGNLKVNCLIYYGIFSIDKNDIIQHPKTRYESLIKDLSDHSNPEVGHYFERSWCAVFHPMNETDIIKYNRIN